MHLEQIILVAANLAFLPVVNAMGGKRVHPAITPVTEPHHNGCLVTLRRRAIGGLDPVVGGAACCIRLNHSRTIRGYLVTVGDHCYDVTANNLPANWYTHATPAECPDVPGTE